LTSGLAVGDKVRHLYHPEWGEGKVYHASKNVCLATWEYHVQQIPLPIYCVEKIEP
jgi:hypothetical protein